MYGQLIAQRKLVLMPALDGENIFAGLPVIPISADADQLIARAADGIAATL